MGNGVMAKDKTKSRRISDTIIVVVVAISILLVVLELANNVLTALAG